MKVGVVGPYREHATETVDGLLVIAAAALLAFLGTRYRVEADWSQSQAANLGQSSQALLASLEGPVEVVSYARPAGGLRAAIADFIERYRRVKPDLALRFVDPDADPAAMREAGIGVDGEMEIRYRGRSERVTAIRALQRYTGSSADGTVTDHELRRRGEAWISVGPRIGPRLTFSVEATARSGDLGDSQRRLNELGAGLSFEAAL